MSNLVIQRRTVRKYNIQVLNMASYKVGAPRCIGSPVVLFLHAQLCSRVNPPHPPLFVANLFPLGTSRPSVKGTLFTAPDILHYYGLRILVFSPFLFFLGLLHYTPLSSSCILMSCVVELFSSGQIFRKPFVVVSSSASSTSCSASV